MKALISDEVLNAASESALRGLARLVEAAVAAAEPLAALDPGLNVSIERDGDRLVVVMVAGLEVGP